MLTEALGTPCVTVAPSPRGEKLCEIAGFVELNL